MTITDQAAKKLGVAASGLIDGPTCWIDGTWEDGALHPGATAARGGTGYGADGYPVAGHGSGRIHLGKPATERLWVRRVQ